MTAKAARDTQARTFIGRDAVAAGLADDVGLFNDVLSDLERTASKPASTISVPPTRTKSVSTSEYSDGFSAGWNAQKERIKAILALPESAKNPDASRRLAFDTDMGVEQVRANLAASSGSGSAGTPSQAGAVPWDEIIDQVNAQRGFKGHRR